MSFAYTNYRHRTKPFSTKERRQRDREAAEEQLHKMRKPSPEEFQRELARRQGEHWDD